jgi:integrase
LPKAHRRRLVVLRQFFRFARSQHIVLIDPTRTLIVKGRSHFRGRTLTLDQQRELFRRWTTSEHVHPHEALLGMLALLHGASSTEVRMLQVTDIDPAAQTVRLHKRPHPVPLDPASWTVLQRCLAHREAMPTANPHVMVTKGTKAGRNPASAACPSHVLDDCGYPPRMIRSTRLVDLVNTMDPKLVAAAFGMDTQATLIYLADHVEREAELASRATAKSTRPPR